MHLHLLPATPAAEPSAIGIFLDTLIHEVLPTCALGAGLMAVIWVACAAITVAGAFIGGIVVVAVRNGARCLVRYIRRRRGAEYARIVTVDEDGAHAKVVNFERYRRRRQGGGSGRNKRDGTTERRRDDPA